MCLMYCLLLSYGRICVTTQHTAHIYRMSFTDDQYPCLPSHSWRRRTTEWYFEKYSENIYSRDVQPKECLRRWCVAGKLFSSFSCGLCFVFSGGYSASCWPNDAVRVCIFVLIVNILFRVCACTFAYARKHIPCPVEYVHACAQIREPVPYTRILWIINDGDTYKHMRSYDFPGARVQVAANICTRISTCARMHTYGHDVHSQRTHAHTPRTYTFSNHRSILLISSYIWEHTCVDKYTDIRTCICIFTCFLMGRHWWAT